MSLFKSNGWKVAPMAVFYILTVAAVALAFPPGNDGDTVADNVLGQPDFVHNAANTPDASTMNISGNLARIAIDKSVSPNRVYVTDSNNNRVLGYSSISALTNGASATIVIGQPDLFSAACNIFGRTAQSICGPQGVAVDSVGNLWVADSSNNRVLEYNKPFSQTIKGGFKANAVLGQGNSFTSNGCNNSGGGPSNGSFCDPEGIALDASNHLWVADRSNSRILEFNSPLTSDVANFVIGQPNFNVNTCNNGGLTANSECNSDGVAVDSNNNLYVADPSNNRVLEYNNPLATNNHTANHVWGQGGLFTTNNCNNIALSSTSLCGPTGVGLDGSNNLYIADSSNNRILEYNESANPPTNLTANHVFGQDGSFTSSNDCNHSALGAASVCGPQDAKISGSALLATDTGNNRVLIYIAPVSTQTANIELGQPDFLHNSANSVDAEGMNGAHGITVDAANHLYVVDNQNHRVLGYTNAASFVNNAPASLVIGQKDFFSGSCNQGSSPTASTFCFPAAVAADSGNNLYVSDIQNNRILEFNAPFAQGKSQGFVANKVYGQTGFTSGGCNHNTSTPSATTLCNPDGLAVDTHNNLYVADRSNHRVLEYPSGSTTAVREFGQGSAGTNFTSATCNNGGVSASSLCNPFGVATDSKNNVYIADHDNSRALEYNETTNPPSNFTANKVFGQTGIFTTNTCNQGGLTADSLCTPHKLTVDSHSNVYISDVGNNRVLEYNTPLTSGTTAHLVFGQVDSFTTNRCDFNASPSAASLCGPVGIAVDSAQDLLVGDFTNNRVLKYLQPLAAPGVVNLSPSPEGFGSVPQHTTSVTRTVTATNAGIVPVLFTGFSISGTNAVDFKIVSTTCHGYVKAGANCTTGLTFTPSAAVGTAENATLTLFDNASNANQKDSLTGTSG